jgi:hypothetical protein
MTASMGTGMRRGATRGSRRIEKGRDGGGICRPFLLATRARRDARGTSTSGTMNIGSMRDNVDGWLGA